MTHPTLVGMRIAGGRSGAARTAWKRIREPANAPPAHPNRSTSSERRRRAPEHPARPTRRNRGPARGPASARRTDARLLGGAHPVRRSNARELERQGHDIQLLGAALGLWVLVMLAITSSS
jgi:hypothetical protein